MESLKMFRNLGKRIRIGRLGGLLVTLGISLAACQSPEGSAALSLEGEGDPSRSFSKNIVGGVISQVKSLPGSRSVSLVIRETRLTRGGRPLCRRPTGRILKVGRVAQIFSARHRSLKSAFVVTGEKIRSGLRSLRPGECVSVVPEDVVEGRSLLQGPMIEFVEESSVAERNEILGSGEVEVWDRPLPAKTMARRNHPSPQILHAVPAS
ncbi:MAG: hypothetical protein ACP5OP_01815 [Leptospirillia bacterium]